MPGELDFAIDLDSVRDRLRTLAYFNGVDSLQDAVNVIENMNALPPWAFVSVASETAEKNVTTGQHVQRVNVSISTLFCVPAERADGGAGDIVDETRKAVIRILLAWTPGRGISPFNYERYLPRATGDGLVWVEVLMRTAYRLSAE